MRRAHVVVGAALAAMAASMGAPAEAREVKLSGMDIAPAFVLKPNFTNRHSAFGGFRGFGRGKPTRNDRVRELVKAGALIVAEIERLHRKAARS